MYRLIFYSLTLKGLSSSSGMLWSPYWARSFSPLLSNLAAASSTLVNQEQKRSADGWKLCNDAIPEFKSLPLEETPELRLSYLDSNTESHLTVIPNKIRKQRKKALFLGFFLLSDHHTKCIDGAYLPPVYIFGERFELVRIIVGIRGYQWLRQIIQVVDVRFVLVNISMEVLQRKTRLKLAMLALYKLRSLSTLFF